MKRNKKTEKYKEFLRLQNAYYENREAQRNLGYKPFDNPIHYGYEAYFVLRDDVTRREDADKLQYILDNFSKRAWSRRKDFKVWSYGRNSTVDVTPGFKELDSYAYEKLPPWAKKYFYSYEAKGWGGKTYTKYVVVIPGHFIVNKVVKSYKTHYKVTDEILKQEEAEISARIESQFYNEQLKHWKRHNSLKWGKKFLNRKDRSYNKMALKKNMSMTFAKYDDINDDWGSWLYDWCDDFYEFKYRHKHYGKWIFD